MRIFPFCLLPFVFAGALHAAPLRPRLLVDPADRQAMLENVKNVPWMKEVYGALVEQVAPYADRHVKDPVWIISRLPMNWETHYTTDFTEKERWVRGEGKAPVPTPRFAGARDWASATHRLGSIEEMPPYNDQGGSIKAKNAQGVWEWVNPGTTANSIEGYASHMMALAADAGFLYWMTGEEKYASLGADILWTYWHGFSFKKAPPESEDKRIIGCTSFEVIHDKIAVPSATAFDFLHDYLQQTRRDPTVIEAQFKRVADRIEEGGSADGNWNLFQARYITYLGLALEEDAAYSDRKGRQHYADVVLNACEAHQKGLNQVVKEGYDARTAIWPEAFGYGATVTDSITSIGALLGRSRLGGDLLKNDILFRAALVQFQLVMPNGYSNAIGDTDSSPVRTAQLELLLAHAVRTGQQDRSEPLSAALHEEIATGRYNRSKLIDLEQLCLYLPELPPAPESAQPPQSRTFFAEPFAAVMLRNPGGSPETSLAATFYGTKGGHTHENGLAIELFGAGFTLAPDPGRGSSYWQPDHREYYRQMPAHNTVIVDGSSHYKNGNPKLDIIALDPASTGTAVSPNFGMAAANFRLSEPATQQRRLLALVRTSDKGGFYLDVFRSRAEDPGHQSHDYLYHGLGAGIDLADATGSRLMLSGSHELTQANGNLKGYDYFKNEKSVTWDKDLRMLVTTPEVHAAMSIWMAGGPNRQVFTVEAPAPRSFSKGVGPKALAAALMPTLLVRQRAEAWENPFAVIYDPYTDKAGPNVKAVEKLPVTPGSGDVAFAVSDASGGSTMLFAPGNDTAAGPEWKITGTFAAARTRDSRVTELYLGHGTSFSFGGYTLESADGLPVAASLLRGPAGWELTSTRLVKLTLPAGESEVPLKRTLLK